MHSSNDHRSNYARALFFSTGIGVVFCSFFLYKMTYQIFTYLIKMIDVDSCLNNLNIILLLLTLFFMGAVFL